MTRMLITAAIAVGILGSTTASAQVMKDLNELSIGTGLFEGNKYSTEDHTTKFFLLRTSYGRFLTDRVEVGPALVVSKVTGSDALGQVGGFFDYHFGMTTSKMVPYAEISLRSGFGDPNSNPVVIGFQGGVKAFVGGGGGVIGFGPFYNYLKFDKAKKGDSHWNEFGVNAFVSKFF